MVVLMHTYDEQALVHDLANLTPARRTAFAAACAQRLLPLYQRFAEQSAAADAEQLVAIVEHVWATLDGQEPHDLAADQDQAEELVPDDEDDDWIFESGYAQNAAASAAYAVRSWLTSDPQEAAWAARQVYEAADYAAQHAVLDGDTSGDVETALLDSKIVQQALAGLVGDLARLQAESCDFHTLRAHADDEGRDWSTSLP